MKKISVWGIKIIDPQSLGGRGALDPIVREIKTFYCIIYLYISTAKQNNIFIILFA